MGIDQYSKIADDNTDISGINIAEGCAPSNINNAIRQLMADIATDVAPGMGTGTPTNPGFVPTGGTAGEFLGVTEDGNSYEFMNIPLATPTNHGLVSSGGLPWQVYGVSSDGQSYGFMAGNATNGSALMVRNDTMVWGQMYALGDFAFTMYAPEELAEYKPGWIFMGGQGYDLTSFEGGRLNSLPDGFKQRWGITVEGNTIYAPSMFHEDGRGYFVRAATATTVGAAEQDIIRNFTGRVHNLDYLGFISVAQGYANGVFAKSIERYSTISGTAQGVTHDILIDASLQVPTGPENRPIDRGMTPIMFVGEQ